MYVYMFSSIFVDEPVISAYPNGSLVREGDSVILHCMIKDIVSTTISYSWTRDFKLVSDDVDITLYGNGSLYILNFNHSSHSGKYECNVQLEVISSTAQPIIFDIGAAYITTGIYSILYYYTIYIISFLQYHQQYHLLHCMFLLLLLLQQLYCYVGQSQ